MSNNNGITNDWVSSVIDDFIRTSPLNTMQDGSNEPAWDQALVGFSSGADQLWQQYKEYVGAFHWTPWEVFNQHSREKNASADQLTVISWVLPQREMVRKANKRQKRYPAEEWARIRVFGEKFNVALRNHVVDCFNERRVPAVAPMLLPNWTIVQSQRYSFASSWSERHAAHAAGLGTFGLCDGLITAQGKAMRLGSVVVKASLEPTPRLYQSHQAYCLFHAEGTCGKCIDRCPARAITTEGHDKIKCQQYLARTREYIKTKFGFEGYGCGLCQVGVPCESMIPVKSARDAFEKKILPPPPPPLA
jgi:epoxyqueuosine reductase QueG